MQRWTTGCQFSACTLRHTLPARCASLGHCLCTAFTHPTLSFLCNGRSIDNSLNVYVSIPATGPSPREREGKSSGRVIVHTMLYTGSSIPVGWYINHTTHRPRSRSPIGADVIAEGCGDRTPISVSLVVPHSSRSFPHTPPRVFWTTPLSPLTGVPINCTFYGISVFRNG